MGASSRDQQREEWEKHLAGRSAVLTSGATVPLKTRKYHNEPTAIDGHQFPSKREANRYLYLRERLGRGEIHSLELQPKFPLHVVRPDGVKVEVGAYRADFRYTCGVHVVVEDAKGIATEPYRMRKRHVEAEYGIEVIEV